MEEVKLWYPHSNFRGWGAGRGYGRSGVQSLGGHLGTWDFLGEVTEKLYIRKNGDAPANQPKVAGVCRQ